jgi:hypothetical protein
MLYLCRKGCEVDSTKVVQVPHRCEAHDEAYVYGKQLKRAAMKRTIGPRTKTRKALKQGRGFQASRAQQAKVRDLPCLYCGRDGQVVAIDPAHVFPRRLVSCECADGVVPLCRLHHEQYDRGELDLLPLLITNDLRVEMVHHILVHAASMIRVLEHMTGSKVEFAK